VVTAAVLGYVVANERAFTLRLQAQRALCLVRIERPAPGRDADG
jgi:hypothetical protein